MIEKDQDRVGTKLAEGRYTILGRIGVGSMGHVYRAHDSRLGTDVVIKFPISADASLDRADLIERFGREVRSLVKLSHPHVVKIIDVGADGGTPYVVLQYLSGGTLKDRLCSGSAGEPRPMPPESLYQWLPDVARALDFLHAQGHIHRDIKPANILFDGFGNAFLGDFGIIKALTADEGNDAWKDNSLTAPGFLLGTPGYVAPEIVMGTAPDGRSDQYALALTVHEILTGYNLMAGPSPSATIVNQTKVELPLLNELVPRIPRRLAEAVRRGLAKEPNARFPSCLVLAQEILAEVAVVAPSDAVETETGLIAGMASCPKCRGPVPVGRAVEGDRLRCQRCLTNMLVRVADGRVTLATDGTAETTRPIWPSGGSGEINLGPTRAMPRPNAAISAPGPEGPTLATAVPTTRRRILRGVALGAAALIVGIGAWGLGQVFLSGPPPGGRLPARPRDDNARAVPPVAADDQPVEVNIAYGTEKKKWFQAAVREFEQTPAGRHVRINLVGKGSVEGAHVILAGEKPTPFHVWSPASSAYRDVFVQEWKIRGGGNPIFRGQDLALTPMVFVLWKSRHDEFLKKYGKLNFKTIGQAMGEPGGWGSIADKPDWGLFKFAHADPEQSNSGMLALVLMAYEYAGKQRDLTLGDVVQPPFQTWFREFERGVTRHGGTLTHSTGTLMEEMVKRGPSQYDALLLYENLAIEHMKMAHDNWGADGELHVVYPEPNIWNEHPYYILDVPWSGQAERKAAAEFLDFLMSERIQRLALEDGFRPGNSSVSVRFPGSPLLANESHGVRIEIPLRLCEPPRAEVLSSLLSSFQRSPH